MASTSLQRRALSRHLLGAGLELGPGHSPFTLLEPGATVRLVDRWEPDTNHDLFPELGPEAVFPRPDIVSNLDVDRLGAITSGSVDFVVCSHILEHLADPIGQIGDVYRVLRPGGVLLILLPDRRKTFDCCRIPTSLAHLVVEHEQGVTEVDDDHIREFIAGVDEAARGESGGPAELSLGEGPSRAWYELHRRRSIHAHCWTQEEFFEVLNYAVDALGQRWEFVDGLLSGEGEPEGIEFGFVLRRSGIGISSVAFAERFRTTWFCWRAARDAAVSLQPGPTATGEKMARQGSETWGPDGSSSVGLPMHEVESELTLVKKELLALRATKTFRYTAGARRLYSKLRNGS